MTKTKPTELEALRGFRKAVKAAFRDLEGRELVMEIREALRDLEYELKDIKKR